MSGGTRFCVDDVEDLQRPAGGIVTVAAGNISVG